MSIPKPLSTQHDRARKPGKFHTFPDGSDTLPQTNTHGRNTVLTALLFQHVDQRGGNTGTGATQRVTQCNRTTVDVYTAVSDFGQFQVFHARQRLSREGFVQFPVVDVSNIQTRTLQSFLGGRNRAVTHDRSIHTSNGHRHDTGAWLQTQFHGFFVAHQQPGGSTVSNLRRGTSRYGTALRIERRTQSTQAFCSGFRTDGLVLGYQDFFAIFIVTVHRYDFVLELTFQRGFVSQTVRTSTELILLLTGNTVHFAQHFCSQTHHVGGLGR